MLHNSARFCVCKIIQAPTLLGFLCAVSTAWASCYDTAMTQASIANCAQSERHGYDKELNAAYKAVMKKFSSDKIFCERLRKSQRAWLAYRDLELDVVSSDGSVSSQCHSAREIQLNKERTEYFKSLLDAKEGDVCAP